MVCTAIISGVGAGLCYGPSMVIIGIYFEKRRALANGITFSASSFGSFCFPPLIQYCLDSYGLQGTLLIMGGVMFHISAAGMLFRPPEFYQIQRELLMRQIIHRSGDMNIHQSKESGLVGAASDTEPPLRSLKHSRVTATSDSNPVSSEVCHGAICGNNDTNRASDFASPDVSKGTQEYDSAATTQDSDNLETGGSCRSTSDTTTCTNAEVCTLSVSSLDTRSVAKISPESTQVQKTPSQWNILKNPLLYIYALTLPLTDSSFVNCSVMVYPYATYIGISNFKGVFLVSILELFQRDFQLPRRIFIRFQLRREETHISGSDTCPRNRDMCVAADEAVRVPGHHVWVMRLLFCRGRCVSSSPGRRGVRNCQPPSRVRRCVRVSIDSIYAHQFQD